MKIMYIHGFGSSAESGTVKRLRELLPDAVVVADDVPLQPQDAIAMLHEMATSGVAMAVLVTLIWVGMVIVSSVLESKSNAVVKAEGKV